MWKNTLSIGQKMNSGTLSLNKIDSIKSVSTIASKQKKKGTNQIIDSLAY